MEQVLGLVALIGAAQILNSVKQLKTAAGKCLTAAERILYFYFPIC